MLGRNILKFLFKCQACIYSFFCLQEKQLPQLFKRNSHMTPVGVSVSVNCNGLSWLLCVCARVPVFSRSGKDRFSRQW